MSRRGIPIPAYVLPQHRRLYAKLAHRYLARKPAATAVQVEAAARVQLERQV